MIPDLLAVTLPGPLGEPFMQRAFVVALICGATCGVVGCYVVLRGMAFIGDAVSHAVFPGVAIAFVLRIDLVLGGAVTGIATAVAVALFSQNRRLKEDTIIGVFFAFAFGLGIVVLSTAPGYSGSLESFLFGTILGISDADVRTAALIGAAVLATLGLLHRQLVAVSLDRETAHAAGLRVLWLDMALYAMVTASIILALQAVGNILVLALLITPAACARLLTDRLEVMMVLSPVIGSGSAVVGLYLSYLLGVAAGGMVVLTATAVFLVCFLAAPRHGLLARRLRGGRREGASSSPIPV